MAGKWEKIKCLSHGMDAKRKRRVKKGCPNPLFVKWLQEWKDEAIENGWKSSYTYNKVGDMGLR